MGFTPEQRQRAVEVRQQHAQERKQARLSAGATAVAAPPTPEPEADEGGTSSDVLSELAGLFAKASGKKAGRDKAMNDALELLGKLDPMRYPDIADNQTVLDFVDRVQQQRMQSTDLPPGSLIGTGIAQRKKPWTKADLLKGKDLSLEQADQQHVMPWVVYTPIKTTPVGWNGLIVYFRARQKIYTPKCFVDVFEESLNNEEFAEQHAAWLMNTPGIPYHPDFGGTNGARVRAMDHSHGEYYTPGGGEIDLTPSADLIGLGGTGREEE